MYLSKEANGLLAKLLRVSDIAVIDLVERPLFASLQRLFVLHCAKDKCSTYSILSSIYFGA
jgi:hypothetical protein